MRHKYKTAEKRNILNISLYCVCIRLIYTPCYGVYTNWMAYTHMLAVMLKKTQTVIKTESNSETDKLVKDLIDSDLLRFTIQFFYKTENGLRPFGTGVLAFIHDIHFI